MLFASRGLHQVTSHEIASGAGVAAGTFYLHFKDKHDLFREIVFDAIRALQARLEQARQTAAPDPRTAMQRRANELLNFAEANRDLVRILFGRGGGSATIGAEVLDHLIHWVQDDIRHHSEAHRNEHALDPRVAAQAIVGMWARVVTWWAEQPEAISRETVLETLVTMQLSGVVGVRLRD